MQKSMSRLVPAGLAVLAALLQLVPNQAGAWSPHRVFRDVVEILVWIEKNEDKSEGGLIEVETIRANLATLLTELLEDRRLDVSIRQARSRGLPFPLLSQLDPKTLAVIVRVTVRHGPTDSGSPSCLGAVAINLERDRPKYGCEEDAYRLDFAPEPFVTRCEAAAVSAEVPRAAEPLLKQIADVLGRLPRPYERPPGARQRRER